MIGLLVGEVQMFAALGPVLPLVQARQGEELAVSTPKRTPLMPGAGDIKRCRALLRRRPSGFSFRATRLWPWSRT
jgi:hypothetical protein